MTTASIDQLLELKERLTRQLEEQHALLQKMEKTSLELERGIKQFARGKPITKSGPVRNSGRKLANDLVRAVDAGDIAAVRKLLEDGADPNTYNQDREPILMIAAAGHFTEIVRDLLKHGANVDATDETDGTALLAAVRDDNIQVVKELVKHGAAVNLKNVDGDTPLTNAACWGSRLVVKYLLENSADPNISDGLGITAADLARQQGHAAIASIIERASKRG